MSKLRALVLGAALGLAGGQALAADPGLTDKEITIGLFNPMSGPLVSFGYDSLYAAKMWYDDVNKKGGIHGRMIKTIIEDDKCNAQDVVAIAKKFVTVDNVFMINGGACTAAAVAAQEYVTREKVPFVMINAAGDGALFPSTRYVFGAAGGTQRAQVVTQVAGDVDLVLQLLARVAQGVAQALDAGARARGGLVEAAHHGAHVGGGLAQPLDAAIEEETRRDGRQQKHGDQSIHEDADGRIQVHCSVHPLLSYAVRRVTLPACAGLARHEWRRGRRRGPSGRASTARRRSSGARSSPGGR